MAIKSWAQMLLELEARERPEARSIETSLGVEEVGLVSQERVVSSTVPTIPSSGMVVVTSDNLEVSQC